ncbi:MAG: M67 family metallopeptidase [Gemmatimonadetes bacterium]|nr:M67 family metallopeptidase [Gemmatimonadota bacterium]
MFTARCVRASRDAKGTGVAGSPPPVNAASAVARLVLTPEAWTAVAQHAASRPSEEVCGMLIGAGEGGAARVARIIPSRNVADPSERGRRFLMEPRDVLDVERTLRGGPERLLGFYHSHPDGTAEPSALDTAYMTLWPATAWLIVPMGPMGAGGTARTPRAWLLEAEAASPSRTNAPPGAPGQAALRELVIEGLPTRCPL